MNVAELIEMLAVLPGDAKVCAPMDDFEFQTRLTIDVENVELISDSAGSQVALLVTEEF